MPPQEGVGCDDGADVGERFARDAVAQHGESVALAIGEPDALSTALLSQDLVFCLEVLDHALLTLVDDAGEDHAEELPVKGIGAQPRRGTDQPSETASAEGLDPTRSKSGTRCVR